MKKLILLLVFLLWAVKADAKLMTLSCFTLHNGLEVAVIENHKAPVALQMLYYKTGSADDPQGKGGIAHLLEHMMFRGTKQVPDRAFNRLADEAGAESNAYTTYTETGYYEFADISKLELMMALEADRMRQLDLSEEAFAAERDIVLQERMQRFESQPAPLFYEMANRIFWQGQPLANPVSGSVEEIKALQRQDAQDFYDRWYRPDNALLVLSGDITAAEAKALVNKYYGGLQNNGRKPQRTYGAGRPAKAVFSLQLEGVEQPRFISLTKLDAGKFSLKEILALELLAEYLTGDDTAYLFDKLVYQEQTFLSVSMDVSYDAALGGALGFYAVPAVENMGAVEMAAQINAAAVQGMAALDAAQLEKVKNRVLSSAVYMQENPESAARFVGEMLLAGYQPEEIMHYDTMVRAVTLDEVIAAWQKAAASDTRLDGYLEGK